MDRKSVLRRFLVHRATTAVTNVLVVVSVALLFVLRLARLPDDVLRVVRLLRSYDGGDAEHLQVKARFFLAVSSISMVFLLATAVLITGIVHRSLEQVAGVNVDVLLNRIELVIMSASVSAAIGITAVANAFLKRLVTRRVQAVNDYIESVLMRGNKLPLHPDEWGDEISELRMQVSRVTNLFVT